MSSDPPDTPPDPQPSFEKKDDLRHLLVSGAINALALVAGISLTVFYFLAARIYGKENFGLYSFTFAAVDILMCIGGMATDKGLTRYIASHHIAKEFDQEASALGTGLWMMAICSGLMAACAYLFAGPITTFFGKPEATSALRAMSPAILFGEAIAIMTWATIAAKVMKYKLYIREFGHPVLLMACALPLASLFSDSLLNLCYGHVVGTFIAALWIVWALRKVFRYLPLSRALFRSSFHKEMFYYCIPMALTDPLNVSVQRASALIIGRFVNPARIGIFAAADTLSRAIGGATMALDPVVMPILAESVKLKNRERLCYNLQLCTRWITILCTPMIIFFILFRAELLQLYGEGFEVGSQTLLIFIGGRFVMAILGLSAGVLTMSGRSKVVLVNQIVVSVFSIAACFYLAARYGIEGAAWSWVLSTVLSYGLILVENYLFERAHPFCASIPRVLLAGALTLGIMWYLIDYLPDSVMLKFVLSSVGMMLIYGALFVLLARTDDDDELLRMLKLKKR